MALAALVGDALACSGLINVREVGKTGFQELCMYLEVLIGGGAILLPLY